MTHEVTHDSRWRLSNSRGIVNTTHAVRETAKQWRGALCLLPDVHICTSVRQKLHESSTAKLSSHMQWRATVPAPCVHTGASTHKLLRQQNVHAFHCNMERCHGVGRVSWCACRVNAGAGIKQQSDNATASGTNARAVGAGSTHVIRCASNTAPQTHERCNQCRDAALRAAALCCGVG